MCSGGVERLTFSALWEMTPEADTVAVRFTKGVIRSRAALTYAEAQARIDDAADNDEITQGARACFLRVGGGGNGWMYRSLLD
jgi:exosome complex exonuclease DIS3/RRP44